MAPSRATARTGLTINKGVPRQLFNRFVARVLRSPFHGIAGFSKLSMLLTYTGRKSGRSYTLPLAYMRDGDTVTTFALFTNTVWWQNLRHDAPVKLRLQGRDYTGIANVIEDPMQVAVGLLNMAQHSPQMTRGGYYGIPRTADGQPDQHALIEAARTRVMIHIKLAPAAAETTNGRTFSPAAKTALQLFTAVHTLIYQLSGGRIWGRISSGNVLLLTTVGRKTGKRRTRPLVYLADDESYVIVGSAGGTATDPLWVRNLRANPRVLVQVGARRQVMTAAIVEGAERKRLWPLLVTMFPGFDEYQRSTTRQLPVIVLRPAA